MNGTMESKHNSVLSQFRDTVKDLFDVIPEDEYLLKWLKARNFDLKKAETMIRNSMAWRQEIGADTILETYEEPEVIRKYYPGGVYGFDREGHPILIYPLGHLDPKGMIRSAKKSDVMKSMVVRNEKLCRLMEKQSEELRTQVSQCVQILDFENFGTKHLYRPAAQMYLEMLKMLEDNYPEMLYRSYIIRAPKAFHIAYALTKPFLSEDTVKKFQILGHDWREKITKDIDPSQLPVHWGGTCKDETGNEACRQHICLGGEIPKSYYLKEQIISDSETFTHTVVKRKSYLHLEYEIMQPGCALRWQFLCKGKIGFGVFMKRGSGKQSVKEMTTLEPIHKYNCQTVPEEGLYLCEYKGVYVLRFDNCFARINKKYLSYCVEILKPGENNLTSEVVQGQEEHAEGDEEELQNSTSED